MRDLTVEPWGAVESLLLASDSGSDHLAGTIRQRVADIVVDELVVRCEVPALDVPVVLQLEISDNAALAGRVLTMDGATMSAGPGWTDGADATIRFDVVDVVESQSLRMWQRYFRRGLIYGLDIFDKSDVTGPRLRAIQGDQNDPEFLAKLGHSIGPLDIIIDDGSHVNEHVKTSFRCLFPFLRLGGLYVVEDLQTAYWPGYGGNDRDLVNADTSIGMLKSLVDGLNRQELSSGIGDSPSYTDRHVVGLHFYHNLAIVEKVSTRRTGYHRSSPGRAPAERLEYRRDSGGPGFPALPTSHGLTRPELEGRRADSLHRGSGSGASVAARGYCMGSAMRRSRGARRNDRPQPGHGCPVRPAGRGRF